ncbi:glycosyltransferase family 2 protein [Paenirhodobacter sp. CAU 1674]|uniref:glycosyltransferase family 2 protein n=1 Tax=Paenirhodobacter sp. CAU 1674 TaxID=3032596 RepID=UPI0023DBD41D|nr:glycosyltransferase family 2 protein [Paenirhodobacter sp. CAU 1674]MDF2142038.1 glycosyltransferase family 2 protein [Paenirhodobacter sp. CAU 1674]
MTAPVTALILTFNEEMHIERCIRSLEGVAERICIVDSFSTDRTVEIARDLGAEVVQNPWPGHAAQFQWGLDHLDIRTGWTLRIDADEYLDEGLRGAIQRWLAAPEPGVNGLHLRRQIMFLGRPIRHGFFYPLHILRLWRSGEGRMEQRRMDEHIVLRDPCTKVLEGGDLVDDNRNDLSWWTAKHNGYATLEVIARIEAAAGHKAAPEKLSGAAARKRWLKEQVYTRLPATLRASLYFFYRYVLGRGFLDGKEGFFFHFLQAFWYRTLVEAKLYELELRAEAADLSPYELLAREGVFEPRED